MYYVCASLSLSLVNTGLCRYSGARKLTFAAFVTSSFLGARGRDSRIHIIHRATKAKTFAKRSLCVCTLHETKKYLDFFSSRVQIKHPSSSSSKPVSLISSSFFSSCVSFFIHTQHDRKRNTQKKREMPARSAIAMGGADVMTFVRSTRPGFPKGLKVRD